MSRTLPEVIALLERIAPLHLAEEWDNVGLLVEPTSASKRPVSRLFLSIDLGERELSEAIRRGADFVISYHPPLFRGMKRVRASVADERVVVRALEAGLSVYSPHTALDAAQGGLNDWLASAFGSGSSSALVPRVREDNAFKVVVFIPRSHVSELRSALSSELGAGSIGNYSECSYELEGRGSFFGNDAAAPRVGEQGRLEFVPEIRLEMRCSRDALKNLGRVIAEHHPYEEPAWDVYPLSAQAGPAVGAGRLLKLGTPITLSDAVTRLKAALGVSTLRVASTEPHHTGTVIERVAECAGAGSSVFDHVKGVDLFVTGELRHHEVLAKLRHGASVILSEHTHTERGYLPVLARRLTELAQGEVEVLISALDAEPLRTV